MSVAEKTVQLASKLYEARDYVRRMTTPGEYKNRITEYQGYIRKGMEKWKLTDIETTMKLVGMVQSFITRSCLLAAYVEMIEPSEPKE